MKRRVILFHENLTLSYTAIVTLMNLKSYLSKIKLGFLNEFLQLHNEIISSFFINCKFSKM